MSRTWAVLDNDFMSLLPCPTCPWRVDRDASTIPGYNQERAVGLLNTVGEEDAFRPIMACHYMQEDGIACKGYLAQVGWSNINVRILCHLREIENPDDVFDACREAGIQLEASYEDVLDKMTKSSG